MNTFNGTPVILGTELKLRVHVDPIDDKQLQDYYFEVEVYTNSASVKYKKEDSDNIILPGDNKDICIVLLNTSDIGVGRVKVKVTAQIPDPDFTDGFRTEIAVEDTDIIIIRK